jgi:glycosyltransferase involved in cell wall biosynthesis
MESPGRILVIDNLAVESLRREVYRCIAGKFGVEVHLLVPKRWRETREVIACEPEESTALRLHASRILFGFRHQRVLYLDLPRLLRTVRPDFVLAVAQPESYAGAQVCIDRRLYAPGAKLALFSSRNIDYPLEGFPYKFKFTHRFCDTLVRRTHPEICFYRPQAAERLLSSYGERLVYVPHMVDCSLFRKEAIGTATENQEEFVVGYIGRLVKEKGVYTLLESMRHLPPHAKLVLVGTGPEGPALRELAIEYGLEGRVQFHGTVPYREVAAMLNRMDVMVLPSLETKHWVELFGRVLIEAMACEVPVVASRTGGIPEVLGDAGVLVDPGDSGALVAVLEGLRSDPKKRSELGRKGRERALKHFDVPVVASLLGKEIMESLKRDPRKDSRE